MTTLDGGNVEFGLRDDGGRFGDGQGAALAANALHPTEVELAAIDKRPTLDNQRITCSAPLRPQFWAITKNIPLRILTRCKHCHVILRAFRNSLS